MLLTNNVVDQYNSIGQQYRGNRGRVCSTSIANKMVVQSYMVDQ